MLLIDNYATIPSHGLDGQIENDYKSLMVIFQRNVNKDEDQNNEMKKKSNQFTPEKFLEDAELKEDFFATIINND